MCAEMRGVDARYDILLLMICFCRAIALLPAADAFARFARQLFAALIFRRRNDAALLPSFYFPPLMSFHVV